MTTTDQNSTPVGVYALSGLMMVPILKVLYSAIIISNYFYVAIILVPLFAYVGIGIVQRWTGAKDLFMAIAVLLCLGAIPDLVSGLLSENTTEMPDALHIAESMVRISIFPLAYFYFKRQDVKSYFRSAS